MCGLGVKGSGLEPFLIGNDAANFPNTIVSAKPSALKPALFEPRIDCWPRAGNGLVVTDEVCREKDFHVFSGHSFVCVLLSIVIGLATVSRGLVPREAGLRLPFGAPVVIPAAYQAVARAKVP